MKKIELSEKEIEVIRQQLAGEFDRVFAPEEDKAALMSVIDKADALMEELDAYDELGDDLILWFWNKYQEQEKAQGNGQAIAWKYGHVRPDEVRSGAQQVQLPLRAAGNWRNRALPAIVSIRINAPFKP